MKKYNIILFITIIVFSLGSCETVDYGDTNVNTNGSSEFNSAALLTAAQRRYIVIGGRSFLGNPNLYVQYQAQPVYQDPSRYAETPTDWSAYYVQTLQNLQQVLNLSNDSEIIEDPSYTSNGSLENQVGLARIMKVLIFKRLTDTYGDIPYFDALNPEIQSPSYTPQKEIYADLIKELQEARDMMDSSTSAPVGDIIYDGDVTSWKKYVNSLLLAISLQISNADLALAQSTFNEALNDPNGVIETLDDEAWYQPINVSSLANPWTAFRPADYNMSEFVQNALQGDANNYSNSITDRRLEIFSTAPETDGLPYGLADYTNIGSTAQISLYITSPVSPFPLMTSAYTFLNRAEAAVKGWTEEDPKTMLEAGIIQSYASLSKLTIDSGLEPIDITADAEAFATARIADAGIVGKEQVIGEEKWAALFSQGFDAWAEYRRTGYPNLTPSPNPLNNGGIPTRYLYPTSEINLNNANWVTGVNNLTPAEDRNTSRVWWDVD